MNLGLRRSVTDELVGYRRELGYVPAAVVDELAEVCGRSPRTLWRWAEQGEAATGVRGGGAADDEPVGLSERELETVVTFSGNVTAAWRDLRAAGQSVPSRRTFHRRWQATDPALRAYAADGADGLKAHQLYVRWQAEERNHTWNIDHEELPVWVVPTGSRTPVKPWLTSVLDDCTRTAMGVVVTFGRPGAEQAVAALAESMRLKPTSRGDQWLGGVPAGVRFDHAAEFKGRLWRQALARLGIAPRPTYPYLSHLNGKVERFQRTTQDEFCAHLPGYTGGPRTLSRRDLFGADAPELLTEPLFIELVLDWVDRYNTERGHDALAGRAPLQAWCEQHTPLRQLSDEQLRLSMLISEHAHKVTKNGVRLDKVDYTAPELADKVGGEVEARFLPHDRSFIEVFQGGQWVCTAWPHTDLSPEEAARLHQRKREQYTRARSLHAAAAERRRLRAAEASPERPVLPPASAVIARDDLAGGDAELLDLTAEPTHDPDGDGAEAGVDRERLARLAAGPYRDDTDTTPADHGTGWAAGDLEAGWAELAELLDADEVGDPTADEADDRSDGVAAKDDGDGGDADKAGEGGGAQ